MLISSLVAFVVGAQPFALDPALCVLQDEPQETHAEPPPSEVPS
jgi:hypothetical protein